MAHSHSDIKRLLNDGGEDEFSSDEELPEWAKQEIALVEAEREAWLTREAQHDSKRIRQVVYDKLMQFPTDLVVSMLGALRIDQLRGASTVSRRFHDLTQRVLADQGSSDEILVIRSPFRDSDFQRFYKSRCNSIEILNPVKSDILRLQGFNLDTLVLMGVNDHDLFKGAPPFKVQTLYMSTMQPPTPIVEAVLAWCNANGTKLRHLEIDKPMTRRVEAPDLYSLKVGGRSYFPGGVWAFQGSPVRDLMLRAQNVYISEGPPPEGFIDASLRPLAPSLRSLSVLFPPDFRDSVKFSISFETLQMCPQLEAAKLHMIRGKPVSLSESNPKLEKLWIRWTDQSTATFKDEFKALNPNIELFVAEHDATQEFTNSNVNRSVTSRSLVRRQ